MRLKSNLVILLLIPILAMCLSFAFNLSYLTSIFLFYLAPGLYLVVRKNLRFQTLKSVVYAVVVSLPFAIVVDYIGTVSGVWKVPVSFFNSRLLGVLPYEDLLWMIAGVFTIIVFYEFLIRENHGTLINKRMWHFVLPASLILAIFILITSISPRIFIWEGAYTYLILGTVFFFIPAALFTYLHPRTIRKSIPIITYFLYVTILFEITATSLNQWIFTGSYILQPLAIFNVLIPWEELFFVGLVGPVAAIALYEIFDRDPIYLKSRA